MLQSQKRKLKQRGKRRAEEEKNLNPKDEFSNPKKLK